MKTFCSLGKFLALAGALLGSGAALAQMPAGSPGDVNIAITKLFGNANAFSADADVQVLDKTQKEWARTQMTFIVLDGKIRVDIDMTQMKSIAMPAETLAMLKQLGLHRLTSVVRPDKKAIYVIYPLAKCYANMPMSKEDAAASGQNFKIEKTPLGKETMDGHACVKTHVLIKDNQGALAVDATTWNAADLKDFPVQLATRENDNTTVMHFRQIKLAPPDARLFDAPAGFTEYPDPQALMFAMAKKAQPPPAATAPAKK